MRASSDDWTKSFRCKLIADAICIMGMTDGTADDIQPRQPTPEDPYPDPFAMVNDFYLRIIEPAFPHAQPAEALMKALGYRKRLSYDDRTVVCLYRQ